MSHLSLRIIGVFVWIVVAIGGFAALPEPPESNPEYSLRRYFSGPSELVVAQDPATRLRANDPVFFQHADGTWAQIGYVVRRTTNPENGVQIAWYTDSVVPGSCRLQLFENDGRLESVIATMLPPEKRQQIQSRLTNLINEFGDELSTAFIPLVEQTLERSLPVIETGIRQSANRHSAELEKLSDRWSKEIVDQRLIPLARKEILPILREHGEPTATVIGRELWNSASIWRFGWRMVYDNSPLPTRNLAQQEWDRFVEQEAIPIFEKHIDDVVASIQLIIRETAANQAIRNELADIASEIAADPETRQLAQVILKESILENEQLREVWSEVWASSEARAALELAGDRLEPVVRQIGDDLLGTQEEGINPDFARVLRNQVLGKDRRWLVASPTQETGAVRIEQAESRMRYPVVHVAGGE